jgi:hypothetical protein
MSLVLAADYRVPDFDHWWATLTGDLPRLPSLGAHHIVVYRSLEDASRIFVTIGVREGGPVDALLRSPVMFSWSSRPSTRERAPPSRSRRPAGPARSAGAATTRSGP